MNVVSRWQAHPPPDDWREQLSVMLGERPRRLGCWAELGLYGALRCLAQCGESRLPEGTVLIVASRTGTHTATREALRQMADEPPDLPMPLTFLQTQPTQLLAALARHLNWRGDALFLAGVEFTVACALAEAQMSQPRAGADENAGEIAGENVGESAGVLVGWVDELAGGQIEWLRLLPDR